MKRWNYTILAVCLAAATSACSGDQHANNAPANDAAVGTGGTATPAADKTADVARGDRDFVADMLADGQAEVELGKLAQQKARSKQVKDFAAMMVRDHTKAGTELKAVATQAHIDLTDAKADDDHGDLRERLAKLSGAEFDREYIKAMVDDHEKAVNDAEDKAEGSDANDVKAWAARTLPTLKKHLEQAKQIDEMLGKRSGT